MKLTKLEANALSKVPTHIKHEILTLTAEGDQLWSQGYHLDSKKQWGAGDKLKAKGNGKYAEADKLYFPKEA